jgi:hypothetical protein
MSSIAAAVSKRTNDMCSYCLGESGIIVYDRHDLTFILAPSCQQEMDLEPPHCLLGLV